MQQQYLRNVVLKIIIIKVFNSLLLYNYRICRFRSLRSNYFRQSKYLRRRIYYTLLANISIAVVKGILLYFYSYITYYFYIFYYLISTLGDQFREVEMGDPFSDEKCFQNFGQKI